MNPTIEQADRDAADQSACTTSGCGWCGYECPNLNAINRAERIANRMGATFVPRETDTEAQAAEIARLREALEWRPIETVPKDGTFVDLWKAAPDKVHGKRIPGVRWDDNRSFNGGFARVAQPSAWVYSHGGEVWLDGGTFTHWRPLPSPPSTALGDTK